MTLRVTIPGWLSYQKAYYWCLHLIVASLLVSTAINSCAVILLSLIWIAESRWKTKAARLGGAPLAMAACILFLCYSVGMLYTVNAAEGLSILRRLLPLLAFPLILGTASLVLTPPQFTYLVLNFVTCCLLGTLVALVRAGWLYAETGSENYFYYHELAALMGMQGIYLSLYVGFCIIFLGCFLLNRRSFQVPINRYVVLVLFVYFTGFLILLSIRTALAGILLSAGLVILLSYQRKGQLLKGILIVTALLVAVTVAVILNPVSREKFKEAFAVKDAIRLDADQDYSLGRNWGGRALRVAIWQCAWDVIREHPLAGVGTGDVQDELQISYRENNFLFAADYNRYNAHNQFIETQLAVGLPGLICLLMLFLLPLPDAIRTRNYFYVSFLIFMFINCITESALIRQKGAIFFGLFNALFAFQFPSKPEAHPEASRTR